MTAIRTIARNTFKEAVRDRVLYLLLFFAGVSIGLSRVLALLTVGDPIKIVKDVGLAAIALFGALMAILIGTGLVSKEIEKRTIFTLLSKPIRRHEFLLGKFAGLVLVLLVMTALMSLVLLLLVFAHTLTLDLKLLAAVFFLFLELVLLTAVAILFSCFSTPILSSLYALGFYLIGHFSWSLATLIQKMRPGAGRTVVAGLRLLLPDLEILNYRTEAVHGLAIPAAAWLTGPAYAVLYTAVVLSVAVLVFRRRDFV
jgi:ABC-type transport system involved in multi-copper enzyme maturation permease subunit